MPASLRLTLLEEALLEAEPFLRVRPLRNHLKLQPSPAADSTQRHWCAHLMLKGLARDHSGPTPGFCAPARSRHGLDILAATLREPD
jgi:hypothetical protein